MMNGWLVRFLRGSIGLSAVTAAGLAFATLTAATEADAGAAPLRAHRALYRVTLDRATRASGVVSVRGAMVYRFARACGAWTAENHTRLHFVYDEGPELETTWTLAAWESDDGQRYRFRVRQTRNGTAVEALQGTAVLDEADGGGARFEGEESPTIDLPPGTLLPTRHLVDLLAAAERGQTIFTRTVFDGTSLDNPYVIGGIVIGGPDGVARQPLFPAVLPPARAWTVHLAFFPIAAQDPEPEFELRVRYREDGVAESLVQDFGDFTLSLELQNIELLAEPDC